MQSRTAGCSMAVPGRDARSSRLTRATWNCRAARSGGVATRAGQIRGMDLEPGQLVQGQVDPAAVQVLAHVADEIRQLERRRRGPRH